ncbi:Heat stress transcription factor A-8 [Raphanus sativus]|nr:Heat stress transcription factor A-8 [Raphanus sativus]
MVDDSSTNSIISWSSNGDNSFVISDTALFSAQLLSKYFKHSKHTTRPSSLNLAKLMQIVGSLLMTGLSGESELWKEVDILKGDKKALAQELVKVRQYQESTYAKMLHLEDRVQGMEESQQEMLSFLVMVMQNPSLLVHIVH